MAISSKKSSSKLIIFLILGLIFGLGILVMVYEGSQRSSDIRSRAAEEEKIVKQWEFNSNTTQGWVGRPASAVTPVNLSVSNGLLHIYNGASPFDIRTSEFAAVSLSFFKRVKISMRVPPLSGNSGCGVSIQNRIPKCTPPVSSPTPTVYSFTAEIHLFNSTTDLANVTFTGTADGEFHEYLVQYPDTLKTYKVNSVKIVFTNIPALSKADVDYIRLVQGRVLPTPTPTATPKPTPTPKPTARPTRPETTPSANITKTGTVTQVNLEGTSKYTLVVSNTEKYSLTILADQPSARGGAPTVSWDTIKQYVGKTATVTGLMQESSVKKDFGGIGIPTASLPTIIVYTIR